MVLEAIDAFAGVIAIETSAGATVRLKDPLTAPTFAVMEQAPLALAVSIPPGATVAMLVSEELQFAELVKSCVLLPL